MSTIPAGEFLVGCDMVEPGCPDFGVPRRRIKLPEFRIDRFEVTKQEYAACVVAGACVQADPGGDDRRPMEFVSIEDARRYCRWRGKRLPTSDEWEKAARGTDGRRFPWGNQDASCDRAVYIDCWLRKWDEVFRKIDPVGTHPTGDSPFGVHDMAGNAPEWTECPARISPCVAVIRSSDHEGPEGLSTYAGYVVRGPEMRAHLMFNPTGFRCAAD